MEQRISVITLGVRDLIRARRFYEDGLGWQAAAAMDEVAFYQLNGIVLSLFARDGLITDGGLEGDVPAGSGSLALAYNVRERDEVDRVLAAAADAGASVTKPAEEKFWGGYGGYFRDPEGHLWEVAWNPGWPIDAEGNVSLGG